MPETIIRVGLFFLSGWAAARMILPGMMDIISGAGFIRLNYCGRAIPSGLGVVFYLSALAVFTASLPFLPEGTGQKSTLFLLALSGYTCLGLADDFWGTGGARGLAGHMKSLIRGRLTTGSVKALAGGVLAVYISAVSGEWAAIPVNALIIALSVNMINILDLRPGRAGKCFLFLSLPVLAAFPGREEAVLMAALAGSLLAYLPFDLKARAMMGDTGSNALGSALGITAAWIFDLQSKAVYLAVLALLHLLAEKRSLTGIIASNRLLDYLDRLGRDKI
jgi:UDP-N-acetylmuramyl pentapeptide phosphotransferase/UDP-N-acetylglucosamine-1-phosphate transferase